jgi:hypothetical protein
MKDRRFLASLALSVALHAIVLLYAVSEAAPDLLAPAPPVATVDVVVSGVTVAGPISAPLTTSQKGEGDKTLAKSEDETRTAAPMPPDDSGTLPAPPDPPKPETRPTASSATNEGQLPPLVHTGNTEALWKMFPRLEVAWVYDRSPKPGETKRVIMEVVLDDSDKICWVDLRSGQRFGNFGLTTMRYNGQSRVVAPDPGRLKIYQRREAIARLAGLPPGNQDRLSWGLYRHRGEIALLLPVQDAFLQMKNEGRITFDPARKNDLEVRWIMDAQGNPSVGEAWYRPEGGKPVRVK